MTRFSVEQNSDIPASVPAFLKRENLGHARREPLAGDASRRRYLRLHHDGITSVLMVAPLELEAVEPFIAIGRYLATLNLSVPLIKAADTTEGLILLEDLGNRTFAAALEEGFSEPDLYAAATDVLACVHAEPAPVSLPGFAASHTLPHFTNERMTREVNLVLEWYWPAATGQEADSSLAESYQAAWAAVWPLAHAGRIVLTQFDYHSPNLLWLPDRDGLRRVGVLDFQDSLQGPAAYDVVSLLQDPRRDVGEGIEAAMLDRYLAARPDVDPQAFRASYALLGAQRAARILGVFVRLWQRDGKPGYMRFQPRVWRLLEQNLAAPELAPVRQWFDAHLPPALRAGRWQG